VTPIDGGGYTSAFPVVSDGGDRAAIARGDAVEVYELPGGRLVRTISHRAPVSAVTFANSGRDVVSGAVDGSVLVTRENGAQLVLQASAGIDAAELLPDGKMIMSDAARRLRVYARDGTVLADLEMLARIMSFRRNGARIVALPSYIGNKAPPLLIDLERYRVIGQLEGHVGQVFSARWAGGRIITAGTDGTVRLWDGATGRLLQTYRGSPRFLADATLTPDGFVIAGDADGLLRFWDAASGAKLWTLQAHKSAIIRIHIEGGDIVTRGFTGEISRWRLPRANQVINACVHHADCATLE
jgi:WD40 repeat protein